MATPTHDPCDLLIHNAVVLTADPAQTVLVGGAVAVRGVSIAAVGPSPELLAGFEAARTIDAEGAVLHPGFIDAHIHISQYSARSVLPRMAGTRINMGAWKAAISDTDEHASISMAAIDYFRAGYTGFVDPGTIFQPDVAAAVAEETGIRVWLTDPYVGDLGQQLASRLPELASQDFLARWPRDTEAALARVGGQLKRNRIPENNVHAFIGLYGEETASPELYRFALATARENAVQFQEHRAYAPDEYLRSEGAAGRPMIEQLQEAGLLGSDVTFVHMNVVRSHEVLVLGESGTCIVWCPYGQLQMLGREKAEPRMLELQRAGATIGLATDIPRAINFDALGGLAVANAAALGTPISPAEVLRMRTTFAAATVGGAAMTGSIEAGKRADLVLRTPADGALGADPIWESAVLGLSEPPALVVVNGRIVFKDGEPTGVDPQRVAASVRESVRSLLDRIGL